MKIKIKLKRPTKAQLKTAAILLTVPLAIPVLIIKTVYDEIKKARK